MPRFALIFSSVCLVLSGLAACGSSEPSTPAPTTRPVKIFVVEGGSTDAIRTFPGTIDAAQRAELAFRVSGRVQQILVKEGDLVEAGQVLARLDPTDYEITLEDRQASFDVAARNFKRSKELIDDGNISRMDFDRMDADYRTSSAALSQAKKRLEYTVLVSPFRGRIAQRRVENYEEIVAKQTVIWLQNIDQLDVVIDLPESVVRSVRPTSKDGVSLVGDETISAVLAYAQFEGRSDEIFILTPKELATKADDQTQTFRATFIMEPPTSFNVLPGMTATVVLDLSGIVNLEGVRWVPVRAVQADSGLKPRVWVLNADTMTVFPQSVEIGRMSGGMVEIRSGLAGGEEIVAVGAPYLAQGMQVTRMAVTEQAVPRADDPS